MVSGARASKVGFRVSSSRSIYKLIRGCEASGFCDCRFRTLEVQGLF